MAPFWRDVSTKLAGHVLERKVSVCPYVDLRMMEGESFFDRLGPNTRHQIRRSQKLYGAIEIQIADDQMADQVRPIAGGEEVPAEAQSDDADLQVRVKGAEILLR